MGEFVKQPLLIGIAGRAGVGKDTAGRFLQLHYALSVVAFADPLKAMLQAMGLSRTELEGAYKELPLRWLDASPRRLLQTLGTEWGREMIDPDLWLKVFGRKLAHDWQVLKASDPDWAGYVITDVRFENEAEFVRRRGHLVHLTRQAAPAVAAHSSETGLDIQTRDFLISNDGDLSQLHDALTEVMRLINERRHGYEPFSY